MKYIRLIVAITWLCSSSLPAADQLFLFHGDSTDATVLQAPGLTPLGTARVAPGSFAAFRASGRTYVVAQERVSVLDSNLETLGEVPFAGTATAAALDRYSSNLLVAAGGRLYRIDTEAGQIVSVLQTGVEPSAIHVPADARVAYLLTAGSRQAKAVDLAANVVLPGSVDLATTPSVFAGALMGAGPEVFQATPVPGGVGGSLTTPTAPTALLAASPSGASLLSSASGLIHRAPNGAVTLLGVAGPVSHSALSADGETAYLALADGNIRSVDIKGAQPPASAWMASAPTAMALVGDSPQQTTDLMKVSGDNQAVLSGSDFDIVVSAPIGGPAASLVSNPSDVVDCPDIANLHPSGVTTITCTAGTVSSSTTVDITISAIGQSVSFTIVVFPTGLPDGLSKISGDGQIVNPGGLFSLVVESISGGLPNQGASIAVMDDSSFMDCPAVGLTTNTAGRATINCTAVGTIPVSEIATITVTDNLLQSVAFTVNLIGQTGSNDALTAVSPNPVTVFEEQSFNLTVSATLGGIPQANVPLTITGGGSVVTCPQQATTGGNGQAIIACGAGPIDADTAVQVTVSDGANNVVFTVDVKNSVLIDGIQKISGDGQTVPQNTQFPQPLVVRAVQGGQPQEGLLLSVSVSNASTTCSVSTLTDANGLGSISCTAGVVVGVTQVTVQVTDAANRMLAQPFSATITPGSGGGGGTATAISLIAGANLSARVGDTLFGAVQLRAEDGVGTPVANAPIFARGPQGVTINPSSTQTNFAGLAAFDVSFGCAPPTGQVQYGLTTTSTEAVSAYILSSGPLNQFLKIQGDAQTGLPGQRLPLALVIESADQCGTVLPNVPLAWSVIPPEAATLESFSSTTNAQGRASVLVRPSAIGGAFQVRATSLQNATVVASFSLQTQNAPTQLRIVSGNLQSVPAGAEAAEPLVVAVLNAASQPVQGVTVSFQVTGGSAMLGAGTATTDALGRAGTTLIAGALRGPVTVQATAAGQTVQFSLTVGGGAPQLQQSGFVNGASFRPGFVSGSTGSIFGVNITEGIDGAVLAPFDASNGFPTLFRGVRVTIAGIAAPILSLANVNGQEQINIQVPFGLPQGVVAVVVENNGTQTTIEGIPVFGSQPGIFEFNFGNQRLAAVLHADFSVVTPSNPARPGEVLLLFATGLGRVTPTVATNQAGPVSPLSTTISTPIVTLGGVGQSVLGSFYAPQLLTVYQINFRVAASTQPGLLRITLEIDGSPSQEAFLPVGAAF